MDQADPYTLGFRAAQRVGFGNAVNPFSPSKLPDKAAAWNQGRAAAEAVAMQARAVRQIAAQNHLRNRMLAHAGVLKIA